MRQRIESIRGHYPCLVAEERGEVIGYAYTSQHRTRAAYRHSVDVTVYVAEGTQRRGVGRTLADLFTLIRTTMPPGAADTLREDEHLAAMAYILEANGFLAGRPLTPSTTALRNIGFGP